MNTRYKLVSWEFDIKAFGAAIMRLHETFSWGELAEIIGCSKSTVYNWAMGNVNDEFPWPRMHNFIAVCNELDLDPREFFVLEDV